MRNCDFISVLLIPIWILVLAQPVIADLLTLEDDYGPTERVRYKAAKYGITDKYSNALVKLNSEFKKKHLKNRGEDVTANLDMGYGRLFSSTDDGYLGFGYVSAKVDTKNRLGLFSSVGYVLPSLDSELLFTYRLLAPQLKRAYRGYGTLNDRLYENSFSLNFTRYTDFFLKETSFNYRFSDVRGKAYRLSREGFLAGHGDVNSHKISAKMAFGTEELDLGLIKGFKTIQSLGYEQVSHDGFYTYDGQVNRRLTSLTTLEQKTSYGLFSASYRHIDTSQTMSLGYLVKGITFYAKETRYSDRDSQQMFGFSVKFNLWNSRDPFYKRKKLFRRTDYSSRKHEQIRHNPSLTANTLVTKPKVRKLQVPMTDS